MTLQNLPNLFDQNVNLRRTGGWFVILEVGLAQLIGLLGAIPGLVSILLNVEVSEELRFLFSRLTPILVVSGQLMVLIIIWRITPNVRKRLSDWSRSIHITDADLEIKSWKEIMNLTSGYAGSAFLVYLFVIVLPPFIITLAQNNVTSSANQSTSAGSSAALFILLGGLASILGSIILAVIIIERSTSDARLILIPEDFEQQRSVRAGALLGTKFQIIIVGLIFITAAIITPVGYQQAIRIADAEVNSLEVIRDLRMQSFLLVGLVILMGIVFSYYATRSVSNPIKELINILQKLQNGDLSQRVPVTTTDELSTVAIYINRMIAQLNFLNSTLEQQVSERTAEAEMARQLSETRAQEMKSISEISRAISSEQKLEILLPLVTRLVSESFGFYHVGIFFVDETNNFAHLQAANSEGGQRMLARGHRLELGKGLVGTVAQSGKPRIALDVGFDAVFFNNPDLPKTRSEMALPLNVRRKTIGVLDVQSTISGAFTELDADTLGILADQVAIAIDNARLFTKTQQALNEVQALYNQYLQKEWRALQAKTRNVGYWQTLSGGKNLEKPVETEEIRQVVQTGQSVISKSNEAETDPAVIVPIKLRGQTIGVLNIKATSKNREFSRDELNLIRSVTDRLALALENARLFEETTQRAERERLVTEITGKIRSHNDPQAMIETAIQELRTVLGASRVNIITQKPEGKD